MVSRGHQGLHLALSHLFFNAEFGNVLEHQVQQLEQGFLDLGLVFSHKRDAVAVGGDERLDGNDVGPDWRSAWVSAVVSSAKRVSSVPSAGWVYSIMRPSWPKNSERQCRDRYFAWLVRRPLPDSVSALAGNEPTIGNQGRLDTFQFSRSIAYSSKPFCFAVCARAVPWQFRARSRPETVLWQECPQSVVESPGSWRA